ncbi:MAG: hypothetical protein BWY86_01208 [Candidatus Aminicenantes bacterium ADurb.Bin508]|nr:MAG: hypothetical protein BWY86_01208 [Candidatus Aminicenantes bacterium ADurb.Bin508]
MGEGLRTGTSLEDLSLEGKGLAPAWETPQAHGLDVLFGITPVQEILESIFPLFAP